jgi:HPr kinase/phosphorylase
MVDIFEVGVLLQGPSGIGKSECALELVMRGHRLVADDVVEFDYRPPGVVFGAAAPLLQYHIEVRRARDPQHQGPLRGDRGAERKRLDLVVQLELEREDGEYDRIGLDDRRGRMLGVPVREVCVPVRPGRNVSAIIEIAAATSCCARRGTTRPRASSSASSRGSGWDRPARRPRSSAAARRPCPPPRARPRRRRSAAVTDAPR